MRLDELIVKAVENVNEELGIEELKTLDGSTPLFMLLDSLGTLDLILELESLLEEETGRYIAVADETSMDEEKTPFQDIETLEAYLKERIEHASH